MKYRQIDEIVSLDPGRQLVARRTLRADEEYLRDHFPRFPVMPGVMMLEALHQSAVWLIHVGNDFEYPLVLLREVKGVKFGDFLAPGETLEITADVLKTDGDRTTIKASATKSGRTTVSARLVLQTALTGDDVALGTDEAVRRETRRQFNRLFPKHAAP